MSHKKITDSQWIILTGILLLAVFFRLLFHYSTPLIPGINGGYYPLMVREMMQADGLGRFFSMAFQDLPLLFWIESVTSELISLFSNDPDLAVLHASKIVDSVLPVLAALPVYLLARSITKNQLLPLLLAAFVVLYFPVSYLLTGDAQKNAIALIGLTGTFTTTITYLQNPSRQKLWILGIFLLITGLTHFGTLLIATIGTFFALILAQNNSIPTGKRLVLVLISVLVAALIIYVLIPSRGTRLLELLRHPFELFSHPVLLYWIRGQAVYTPLVIGFGLITHLLSVVLLISAIKMKSALPWALLAVFLSSPLLGHEWHLRLLIFAHIPLSYVIILNWQAFSKTSRQITCFTLTGLIMASVIVLFSSRKPPSISQLQMKELKELAQLNRVGSTDLVITQHGLEWWTAWFLDCQIAHEGALMPEDFRDRNVYVLTPAHQPSGSLVRNQPSFTMPFTPKSTKATWEGETLRLYLVNAADFIYYLPDESHIGTGLIIQTERGNWVFNSLGFENPLDLAVDQIRLINKQPPLTQYRVFGEKGLFSLKIHVRSLQILPN